MAIGFMVDLIGAKQRGAQQRKTYYRHAATLALLLAVSIPVCAQDVSVVGLFPPSKVLLSVDGGSPRTVAVDSSFNGVKVVAVDERGATLEVGGRKQYIPMGSHYAAIPNSASNNSNNKSITLSADPRGHFVTEGTINGGHMRFLVDTGASSIALSTQDAQRLGLNLKSARQTHINTANGVAVGYVIKLTEVNIGGIVLYGVEAVVSDGMMTGMALLGMTFLNRMEMKRDGQTMTLTKRY